MADLTYDSIEIGREIGPYTYPLPERLPRHLEAIEAQHPWYRERSPWGPPIVPPTILGNATLRFLDSTAPPLAGTLHVKQELEFPSPLRADRRLIGYGQFVDKYERRGRRWFVFQARFRDESGLILGYSTVTLALPERVETKDDKPHEQPPEPSRPGELTPVVRLINQERMTAYSEDSANARRGRSIHVQAEAAKAAGFSRTVAQGLMSADYIGELMTDVLGRGWLEGGGLSLAFVKPVLEGDTLTANGRLIDRADEGAYIRNMYEVWCENQSGELVTVGTASGLIPSE